MALTKKVNGVEYEVLRFPMKNLNISQGAYGTFSHQGVPALDICGKDTGIEETLAPCKMRLAAYGAANEGNPIWLESVNKVLFADGTINYATIMILHDNYVGDIIAHATNGGIWEQWQSCADEGTSGAALGKLDCSFA